MPIRAIQYQQNPANYHDNNSIIMQLILFELVQAFKNTRAIEQTLQNIEKLPKRKPVHYTRIHEAVTRLAGQSEQYSRIFTWNLNDGILGKIKDYCSFFANNIKSKKQEAAALHQQADIVWLAGLDCLDVTRMPRRPDLAVIKAAVEKLQKKLKRFSKILASILPLFKKDENVLFFLLEQQKELDVIFGAGFISKLFGKMFPKGLQHAETFLVQKYSERGFAHLEEQISQHLSKLGSAKV